MPSNKLVFAAAAVVGGLVIGGLGAVNLHSSPQLVHPARHASPSVAKPVTRAPKADAATGFDSYSGAQDLTPYVTAVNFGSFTTGEGTEPHEPTTFDGTTSGNVVLVSNWARYTAPADGLLTLSNDVPPMNYVPNQAYAVFTGKTMATAKRIAWATSEGLGSTKLQLSSIPITRGVTYHIQLSELGTPGSQPADGWTNAALYVTFTPPVNDARGHATTESGTAWAQQGTELGATLESDWEHPAKAGASGFPRVSSTWYKWTALAGGTISPTVYGRVGGYDYLAVFERSTGRHFTEIAYGDDWGDGSRVGLDPIAVRAGQTYYFAVGNLQSGTPGGFSISAKVTYTGPTVASVSPSSGTLAGGTRVTITGTRLTNASIVYFGQFPGTNIHRISSTKILVTAPAGLAKGTVPVVVTASEQTSAVVGASHFTYK